MCPSFQVFNRGGSTVSAARGAGRLGVVDKIQLAKVAVCSCTQYSFDDFHAVTGRYITTIFLNVFL